MTNYFTENEIHVCGVQRSGQHAIIIWLIGHFNNVCFKNSVPPMYGRAYTVSPPWRYFDIEQRGFEEEMNNERNMRLNQDAVIFGTEYQSLHLQINPTIETYKREVVEYYKLDAFSKYKYYVGVIRSPWNQLASILEWKRRWYLKNKERFISSWCAMAKEYLGITNVIPSPKTIINYDQWFADQKYRKQISKKMGLKFTDRGVNIVMPMGRSKKGSSFDKMECNGNAQKMAVLNRWKEYANNEVEFTEVLKMDDELRDLAIKIFGAFPQGL